MLATIPAAVFWLAVAVTAAAGVWAAKQEDWKVTAIAVLAVVMAFIVQFI